MRDTVQLLLFGSSIIALATSSALGQETKSGTVAASPAPTDQNALEEIIVTARRVEENLQSVPVTASAFSAEGLRNASIQSPQDLQQAVAGVFLSGSASTTNAQYAIRGVTKPVAGAGAPGVVTYFADVPLPAYVSSTPQYDISTIQVLKGPQGTLFGRNTVGGALLIYPVAPGYDFNGYVQASYGNYNSKRLEGALTIPLIDQHISLRVAGRFDRANGTVHNLGAGGDLLNQHDNNVRASLLIEPLDGIKNITIFDYAEQPRGHSNGPAAIALASNLPVPFVQAQIALQQARGPFTVDTGALAGYEGWRSWGITNRTDIDVGRITVTNIFGYRNVYQESYSSFDGLPGAFFDAYNEIKTQQYSDELQVQGKVFDDSLTWLLGAFYSDTPPALRAQQQSLTALGVPLEPIPYNFYGEKSKALFANLTYEIAPEVHVNGGFRYTWDRYSSCGGGGEIAIPARIPSKDCLTRLAAASKLSGKSSAPTWTIGADWKPVDQVFLYATSRRGYKSGGINSPTLGLGFAPFQAFKPEKTTDVELGAKTDFKFGQIASRFNVSIFRSKTKDKQLIGTGISTASFQGAGLACVAPNFTPFLDGDCDPSNDPAGTVLTVGLGDVTTKGLELDGTVSPLPGLIFTGSGTFLSGKSSNYNVPVALAAFLPAGSIPLLFTPKTSFTGSVSYTRALPDNLGDVSVSTQYYRSGKVDFNGYISAPYDVVNGRVDWNDIGGLPLDLGFYVRNLFRKEYVSGPALTVATAIPVSTVLFGPPRTYALELRYRFGTAK